VTTAEVRSPSAAPAPAGRPAGRAAAGARLVWLHLRSRRVPAAVLALAVCGGALRAALHWHWLFSTGPLAQQFPMIIEGGAAAVLAITTHSPFGEPERSTGRWLPYLRLGTALAMTGLTIGILQFAVAVASLNGGVLVLARNVLGVTGIGLLSSLVTGGLLAWILPMAYLAFAEYALLESWTSPWTWPVRPPDDRGAWLCACLAYAVGLIAFTIRGARTRLAEDA
jgi:hypothetical protein